MFDTRLDKNMRDAGAASVHDWPVRRLLRAPQFKIVDSWTLSEGLRYCVLSFLILKLDGKALRLCNGLELVRSLVQLVSGLDSMMTIRNAHRPICSTNLS
jgi:hypothetical protein